ncbi:hypothetical protein J7426_24285 [Tropicibacter sp. R16_0]|uniref:hypothetical protein n=1 Tax=Tropicibacter sp. R16_0 TaxID=2821102 RepID=UPI001ADD1416|nr:hypothetical protein [Tropicibacter sp. R16_0]MBO9453400.1 hypothetical protein [Tropicibacter sp. R16_0]
MGGRLLTTFPIPGSLDAASDRSEGSASDHDEDDDGQFIDVNLQGSSEKVFASGSGIILQSIRIRMSLERRWLHIPAMPLVATAQSLRQRRTAAMRAANAAWQYKAE